MRRRKIRRMKAVLMEYVLIAVLIAAAVVGAVMMFGKSVSQGMNVAATAIVDPNQTSSEQAKARSTKSSAAQKAKQILETIHGDSSGQDNQSDSSEDGHRRVIAPAPNLIAPST